MQKLRRNKKLKIAILLLCVCVVAFSAFSLAYELREANHICLGPHCAICIQLQQLTALRGQFLVAALPGSSAAAALLLCCGVAALYAVFLCAGSPVGLKVKLNN